MAQVCNGLSGSPGYVVALGHGQGAVPADKRVFSCTEIIVPGAAGITANTGNFAHGILAALGAFLVYATHSAWNLGLQHRT